MAQGILLALFRFREPVYYHMFKIEIKSWFGWESIKEQKKADMMATNSSFSLMIQQLCNDLVYTMLYTVTKHTVGITKQGRWTVYQPYDFSNKNKFVIENMLVKKSFYKKRNTIGEPDDNTIGEPDDNTIGEPDDMFEDHNSDGFDKVDTTLTKHKSEYDKLLDKLEEKRQLVKGRSTEKRIEDVDLGKFLG